MNEQNTQAKTQLPGLTAGPKPGNITELRDQLLDAFGALKADPKRALQCKELANVAGKVINTVRIQMDYAELRGDIPEIPFVGKTGGVPLPNPARQAPVRS